MSWVRLPDGKDFYMRPVIEQCISYEAIKAPGPYDLIDICDINDALDAKYENQRRASEQNK